MHSQQGHFLFNFIKVLGSSPLQGAMHPFTGGFALLYRGLRTPSKVIFYVFKLALAGLLSAKPTPRVPSEELDRRSPSFQTLVLAGVLASE